MMIHHLLGLTVLGLASATPLLERQVIPSITTSTSSPVSSSSSPSSSGGQPVPMAAVIAISVVLGTGVIVLLLVHIRQWRRKRQIAEGPQDTTMQSLTAEDLAGTSHRRTRGGPATGAQGSTRGRSRRRGVRRTESGRSVKTLPEYSKEAGDEELVLVRRRSGSMSNDESDENDEQETGNESLPITIRSPSPVRSSPVRSSPARSSPARSSPARSRSPPAITVDHTTLGNNGPSQVQYPSNPGAAPTYLEAMSALDPDAPSRPQVPAPRPGALQRTASGFKELLTRPFAPGSFRSPAGPPISGSGQTTPSGGRSRTGSTSALLHPTISRYSTASTADYPSPWASSHSLLISPPVPNSAMRASFDGSSMPKGGLTKEQMRFLSSNEAVNLVGVRMEDIGARKQRRRSDFSGRGTPGSPSQLGAHLGEGSGVEEMPPPSWEQLDGERRMSEAFDRRNLAIPVDRGVELDEEAVDLSGDQHPSEGSLTIGDSPHEVNGSGSGPVRKIETETAEGPKVELDSPQAHHQGTAR